MKQLIAMVVAGGGAFFICATLSFIVYWNAPIVPCEVTTRQPASWGGYSTQRHDDMCTGKQVKAYEYPRMHHAKRSGDDGVVIGLAMLTLLASLGAGVGALLIAGRKKRPAASAHQQPPLIPAG